MTKIAAGRFIRRWGDCISVENKNNWIKEPFNKLDEAIANAWRHLLIFYSALSGLTEISVVQGHPLRMIPKGITVKQVSDRENQAARDWVNLNIVRDITEALQISLENVYFRILCVEKSPILERLTPEMIDKVIVEHKKWQDTPRWIDKTGLNNKVTDFIDKGMDISHLKGILTGLISIRNCIAHRRAVVGEKEQGTKLKWLSIDQDKTFNNNRTIVIKTHEKSFLRGQQVAFSQMETEDICFTVSMMNSELKKKFLEYLLKKKTLVPGAKDTTSNRITLDYPEYSFAIPLKTLS